MKYSVIVAIVVMALNALALAAPPSDDVTQKMADAIRKQCPDATVERTDDGLVAKQGTMVYTLHSVSKTGEVSEKTHQQEGPNYKGFLLRVVAGDGPYQGAAKVPQTLQGPYFSTFIDAVPAAGGAKHYQISFSYGGQLDPKIKQAILELLPARIDTHAMVGRPLAEVVSENKLDGYHSWPDMNLPAGADQGTTYFLDQGDLHISYSGQPPAVREATFRPSSKSAEERFNEANAAWDRWVRAHGGAAQDKPAGHTPEDRKPTK